MTSYLPLLGARLVLGAAALLSACSTWNASEASAGSAGGPSAGASSGGASSEECTPLDPVPSRLWRLSMAQFSNSVRDLLGLETGPIVNDTGGAAEYAFFSDSAAGVNDALAFSLYEAVRATLDQVRPRIRALAACVPGAGEEQCAEKFARTFGARAFRRELDPTEVTALLAVHAEGSKQSFETGIESMIEAILQAPSFLYRSELGSPGASESTLTPHETATQLSYLFLDSTPDAELVAAAGDGRLATAEGVVAQVDRLLSLERVQRNIDRIVLDWFGARQLLSKTTKSAVMLANLREVDRDQAQLTYDLLVATQLFVEEALWGGSGRVDDLLTSRRMFVNRKLATLYGVPFSGPNALFIPAEFPEAQQRAGILTQPAVLWAVSDPETTSIVHRGLYVHNDILCLDPVPSPGDLLQQPDIKAALAMLPTELDKSNYRMNVNAACKGCHSHIDPYALVLENFDAVGAYRTEADGVTVDPTGEFAVSPALTGSVTGAPAFARALVSDRLFTTCATQKMVSYATGRLIHDRSTCQVRDVHDRFVASDGTIRSLFREIALAGFFRTRVGGAP